MQQQPTTTTVPVTIETANTLLSLGTPLLDLPTPLQRASQFTPMDIPPLFTPALCYPTPVPIELPTLELEQASLLDNDAALVEDDNIEAACPVTPDLPSVVDTNFEDIPARGLPLPSGHILSKSDFEFAIKHFQRVRKARQRAFKRAAEKSGIPYVPRRRKYPPPNEKTKTTKQFEAIPKNSSFISFQPRRSGVPRGVNSRKMRPPQSPPFPPMPPPHPNSRSQGQSARETPLPVPPADLPDLNTPWYQQAIQGNVQIPEDVPPFDQSDLPPRHHFVYDNTFEEDLSYFFTEEDDINFHHNARGMMHLETAFRNFNRHEDVDEALHAIADEVIRHHSALPPGSSGQSCQQKIIQRVHKIRRPQAPVTGLVWEFGRQLDMDNDTDTRWYLDHLKDQLNSMPKPRNEQVCRQRTATFIKDKSHRAIALLALSKAGNAMAQLMIACWRGTLSCPYDQFDLSRGQAFLDLSMCLTFFTLVSLFFWRTGKSVVSSLTATVTTAITSPAVQNTFTDLASVVGKLRAAADNIDTIIATVKAWFKSMYNYIKAAFLRASPFIFPLAKFAINVVVVVIIIETVRTFAAFAERQIVEFLCALTGVPCRINKWFGSKGQSSVNVLPEMVETICEYMTGSAGNILSILGPLPKIVSIAKAIEWIFSNICTLITSIMEYVTGELRGRNAAEQAMLKFAQDVCVFKDRVKKASSEDLVSRDLHAEASRLTDVCTMLQDKAVHSNSQLRNVVVTAFNISTKDLQTAQLQYATRLSSGEPRAVPVVIYLFGDPGVGKSQIFMQWMSDTWATVLAQQNPDDPVLKAPRFTYDHLYACTHGEIYYDGYAQQPVVLIDDFFQMKDPKERATVAATFVNMVSPTPYPLLVADMERKSHVFFNSRVIFCTSNLPVHKLHGASAGLQNISALTSRINLGLEMLDNDHFVLHTASVSFDGSPPILKRTLSYEEAVQLTAAALLARHEEAHAEVTGRAFPPFTGSFLSERLRIGAYKGASFSLLPPEEDDEKGKEKEESPPLSTRQRQDRMRRLRNLHRRGRVDYDDEGGSQGEAGGFIPWFASQIGRSKNREAFAFNRLPLFVVSAIDKYCPHLCYPTPYDFDPDGHLVLDATGQAAAMTYPTWIQSPGMQHYLQSHAVPPTQLDYLAYVCSKNTFTATQPLFLGAAAVGVVAVTAFLFLRAFIPSTAHEKSKAQSFSYDSHSKGNKGRPLRHQRPTQSGARVSPGLRGVRAAANDAALSTGQGDTDTLRTVLARNYVHVAVRAFPKGTEWNQEMVTQPFEAASWGLFIKGDYLLTNHHTLFGWVDLPTEEVYVTITEKGITHTFNMTDLRSKTGGPPHVYRIRGDIVVIQVPKIAPHRDITGHFADALPGYGDVQQIMASFNHTGTDTKLTRKWQPFVRSFPINDEYGEIGSDLDFYNLPNKGGDCGSVYAHIPTAKIFAVHVGGDPWNLLAHGVQIFKQDFDLLPSVPQIEDPLSYVLTEPIPSPEPAPPGSKGQAGGSGPLKVTPTGYYPGIAPIGLVPKEAATWSPSHSRIVRSNHDYDPRSFPFMESDRMPAMLRPTMVDGVLVNPLQNVFKNKLGTIHRLPGPGNLHDLSGFLPPTFNSANVKVIGLGNALFGIPHFLAPMDRHASIGYILKRMGFTNRSQLFGPPPDDPTDISGVHPLLVRLVEQKMAVFKDGRVSPAVFEGFLKDELRPADKASSGSTRLIDPMDLVSLIVQRMVLGTFIEECMKDPVNCPVTLAINVHSTQWGKLYARHCGPDHTRIPIAGDFIVFDYHGINEQQEDFIRLVSMVHPEPLLAKLVILANFVAWHIIGRLLFLRPAGTCSGSLITALYNCFVNFWIHKMAFLAIYSIEDFNQLYMNFVGDDSLCSVPPQLSKFTMQHIAAWCKKWIGITYTAPDKSSDLFVTWETLTFLKRTFVNSPFGYLAPLAESSITDMIKWTESPGDETIMASTMQSFLLESWHYGEEKYRAAEQWARKAMEGIPCYLPDWHHMVSQRKPDYFPAFG